MQEDPNLYSRVLYHLIYVPPLSYSMIYYFIFKGEACIYLQKVPISSFTVELMYRFKYAALLYSLQWHNGGIQVTCTAFDNVLLLICYFGNEDTFICKPVFVNTNTSGLQSSVKPGLLLCIWVCVSIALANQFYIVVVQCLLVCVSSALTFLSVHTFNDKRSPSFSRHHMSVLGVCIFLLVYAYVLMHE